MVQQFSWCSVLTRRKMLGTEGVEGETKLNRVLGLYDLTALGVGSTLGAGVYVLAGQIAKEQAGPSVMLSFAIAALASLLAGVCYAEFGARVPKAGSAYVYSYVCIGEFAAFVIGWNLILEYVIGTASVCRGISLYLDTLINDTLKTTFAQLAPMNWTFLGAYFDFFAFGLVIVFGCALAFGVETSTMANNFCTCLNLSVLVFVIVAGSIKADFSNWTIDPASVNDTMTDLGNGGYFPFGFTGTLKGAATCFFGFVGFDCIATTGEEVRNPRKNIPRSIILSLIVIFLCYFGVSTVLTLMVPYYLQDSNAPLPYAFEAVGWPFAMWIVAVGGLVGLLASLFGALFPLPRVMYSMAEDGLLFRFLGKISPRYRVPVNGSIFAAVLTALIAGLFDLAQLVNLLSIGTLLAYSVVAISVTILRYMDNSDESDRENGNQPLSENSMLTSSGTRITFRVVMLQLFNFKRVPIPNHLSTRIVGTLITVFCLLSLGIGIIFMHAHNALIHNELWVLVVLGILVGLTSLVLLAITLQPREAYRRIFRVPFVPIVPAISIFINIYLMLQLDYMTWIRFGIWMMIGIPMYIACWYDMRKLARNPNPERIEFRQALRDNTTNVDHSKLNGHFMGNAIQSKKSIWNGNSIADVEAGYGNAAYEEANNQLTMKCSDDIMNIEDLGNNLIEKKHANGKIFFVQDSKSYTSIVTADKLDDDNDGHANDGQKMNVNGCDDTNTTTEDERSVLAMLDDVLQAEEDSSYEQLSQRPDYNRKLSMNSEEYPSVIETTTVATVHSSSNSSDQETMPPAEAANESVYIEVKCAAAEMIDDVLASDALWDIYWQRKENAAGGDCAIDLCTEKVTPAPTPPNSVAMRTPSENSITSTESNVHPLHSEKFKKKLSLLFMRQQQKQQQPSMEMPDAKVFHNPTPSPSEEVLPSAPLKQSKSETDVRKLLLSEIRERGTLRGGETRNYAATIPKPPKFDPLLYRGANFAFKIDQQRRSSLGKLPAKTTPAPAHAVRRDTSPAVEQELPFKMRLEAILRRGPSLRTQQHPEMQSARRMSATPEMETHNPPAEPLRPAAITPNEMLINARKSLKPMKNFKYN